MSQNKIHFIGIGGIGMSALARYFKRAQKLAVTGSDLTKSPITEALNKEGIRVKIGHKKGNIGPKTGLVVYNRAISKDSPGYLELMAAKRLGVPVLPYAKVLGLLTKQYQTIAITGSHGKSTTTALAGLSLIAGGFDPTVLLGTKLKEFGGDNVRIGRGLHLVLEADDFGAAFLEYSPAIAVVTNIDREHLDFYKNFSNLKNAFVKFLARTREGGTLILNRDDRALFSLRAKIAVVARRQKLKTIWYSLYDPEAKKIKRVLWITGTHNVSNALAVYKLGKALGIPEKKVLTALGAYRGAWRRMEYRGKFEGALVFDDYAHHPTEIKATLAAFQEKYPGKKIFCVFQPHQAKRLKALFKEFMTAFADADETLLLPIYKVPGRDEKPSKFDSQALARTIQKREPTKWLCYLAEPTPQNLKKSIREIASAVGTPLSRHVVIMMGAGDIVNLTDSLVS